MCVMAMFVCEYSKVCVWARRCVHERPCVCVYVRAHTQAPIHRCIHLYLYIYAYIKVCLRVYVLLILMYVYVYVCERVRVCDYAGALCTHA